MQLIEQLRRWASECDRTNFGCQARKLLLEAAEAIEKLSAASLRTKGEWISVEERLPQEGGAVCENVILFMDNGLVTVGWLNQITNRGYYLDTINDVVIKAPLSRFTHWMPLPEPPNTEVAHDS